MRTIRVDLEYDGTSYSGWQRQADVVTIQETLEKALSKIADEKVIVFFASRTDAGVHARQQVASFSLRASRTPPPAFVSGTNALLPGDIRVYASMEMPLNFHANRDVVEKTYRYFIWNTQRPSVFASRYAWHVRKKLDFSNMLQASKALIGRHDFSSFRTDKPETQTPIRHVYDIRFGRGPGNLRYIDVRANGFLRHMVRNIVGLLAEVGLGKRHPNEVEAILRAKRRNAGGVCAPPEGLFLWSVTY